MQRFLACFIVLAVFALGIFLGYRLAWEHPLPPVPPFGLFGPGSMLPGHEDHPPFPKPTPQQAAALEKEIASLQPQLEAFQQAFRALEEDYHTRFLALLTPEQRDRLAASSHREDDIDWVGEFNQFAEDRIGPPHSPAPPDFRHDARHTLMHLLRIVMYKPTCRILSDRLALTPAQQASLEKLLAARRDAFLTLTRDHPLPFDQLYFTVRDLGLFPQKSSQSPGH